MHGVLLTFGLAPSGLNTPDKRGCEMDHQEFRRRLEEARALAAIQRLEAVEMLAMNVDLRHENGDVHARVRAPAWQGSSGPHEAGPCRAHGTQRFLDA